MELILIFFVILFTAGIAISFIAFIFNMMFQRDRQELTSSSAEKEYGLPPPSNPGQVFVYSIVGSVVFALGGGGIGYYIFGTAFSIKTGFCIVGVIGIYASVFAATGEPPII